MCFKTAFASEVIYLFIYLFLNLFYTLTVTSFGKKRISTTHIKKGVLLKMSWSKNKKKTKNKKPNSDGFEVGWWKNELFASSFAFFNPFSLVLFSSRLLPTYCSESVSVSSKFIILVIFWLGSFYCGFKMSN